MRFEYILLGSWALRRRKDLTKKLSFDLLRNKRLFKSEEKNPFQTIIFFECLGNVSNF